MISGSRRQELTLENILDKTSEYEIYRHYLSHDFKLGEPFPSPFHDDRTPSMSIIPTKTGRLHFTDFGGDHYSGKVIDFVRHLFPWKNYNELLQMIDSDLMLGITNRKIDSSIKKTKEPVIYQQHEPKLFQVKPRSFDSLSLAYWNQYHLDIADLKKWECYVPESLYIDKKKIQLNNNELIFAYLYEGRYWKIYRPYAPKANKWLSNVPHDLLNGIKSLKPGLPAIPTKARKDFMILKKLYHNICETQYEGNNVISNDDLKFLQENFPAVYINFDPDPAGKAAMLYYIRNHGFRHLMVEQNVYKLGIKDLAEKARHMGLDSVEDILKRKRILIS